MTVNEATEPVAWRDTRRSIDERVDHLLETMTLAEKVGQLYGIWVGLDNDGEGVAPHQHDFAALEVPWEEQIRDGLGQLTRPFGTAPVDPLLGAKGLAATQREIMAANRFGIPALVHEEILTGLAAWQATVFPSPLCWGASFDPETVRAMGAEIGASLRALGVHQGLAPVLDVVRDLRWGRVEETIGEDPWLVGMIGSAYVEGVQSAGVVATLKHFAGYSTSRGGRNLAPAAVGARELAEVILPPFEMALRAGAGSIMNSYADIDGVPTAADVSILTDLLRGTYAFEGTVVADYFSIAFLQTLHGVAETQGDAARLALVAGIDVELPTVACYGSPLLAAIADGKVEESVVDRAARRVLRQKIALGLLDDSWSADPPAVHDGAVELDSPAARAVARRLADRSIVLLANDGTLPLTPGRRVAVIGPRADEFSAMMGCYSFPLHVGAQHPDVPMGLEVSTVLDALRGGYDGEITFAQGCPVTGGDTEGIAAAVAEAAEADICVAVLGDLAGLFDRGTSGEGCDAVDLRLPGRQEELLDALVATGTPVVAVLLVGRPYDLSRQSDRLAGVVCGFFPGEEGAEAVADVLTGAVNPSGRLPVSFPSRGSVQPGTYLAPTLGRAGRVSSVDPTALWPFGHGLTYADATWGEVSVDAESWPTDGSVTVTIPLTNNHERDTSEVVQVYLHDPVGETVRPVQRLVGAQRVDLAARGSVEVRLTLHADLTSYVGLLDDRIVDTGGVELWVGASSSDIRARLPLQMTGSRRVVGFDRVMSPRVSVST